MYETAIVGKTAVGIPIFRITFDDGEWWELVTVRTLGADEASKLASRGFDTSIDTEALQMRYAIGRAVLNASTVAWSWEVPVTDEHITSLPEDVVRIATRETSARHLERMFQVGEDQKKVSRGHFFRTILSRIIGMMSTFTERLWSNDYNFRIPRSRSK